MPRKSLDLDVSTPEEVVDVLAAAAERYYESAGELTASWQDKKAGAPWNKIARILESAANRIDTALSGR